MFNKIFGKNTNFETDSTTNAAEDARSIMQTVDDIILQAAWEEYITIKSQDDDFLYSDSTMTPTWLALEKLKKYNGDFTKFTAEEQNLLRALKKGFSIYSDVLHILIRHHNDKDAGKDVFAKYPKLHDALPKQYDNTQHVIEVLIEVVKDYQWQVEHFSMKHAEKIDEALKTMEHLAAPRRSKMASVE